MSKDGYVQVPPNSTGGKVDCSSLSVAGQTVVRQRIVIGDNQSSAGLATVVNNKLSVLASFSSALAVSVGPISKIDAISATVTVAGNVNISTMPAVNISAIPSLTIGAFTAKVSISATAVVAGQVSAVVVGTVPISGTLDKISATVTVAGAVSLTTAVNISAMPHVTVDLVSATVTVAGTVNISSMPAISIGPISTIDKISATVTVAGTVNISSMPAISIGPISTIDKISATVTVAGNVNISSGSLTMSGTLDGISATVTVAGTVNISSMPAISIGPISTIDKISATVVVAGVVSISAASISVSVVNNINISAMPNVNISAMPNVVLAAGANNIGTLNGISATVNVALVGATAKIAISATPSVVLAAGTANFGTLNNISATVVTVNAYRGLSTALSTASHGPKTVTISSSATVALIAAPGAALSIYVDQIVATNGNASILAGLQLYEGSNTGTVAVGQFLAPNGGGFSLNFDPPWKISANTQLSGRLKPSASQVLVTLNFHVAA